MGWCTADLSRRPGRLRPGLRGRGRGRPGPGRRWYAADSEQAILAGYEAALGTADWEDGPAWVVNGPVVLFDSAYAGHAIDPRNRLRIHLEPGRYLTRIAYLEIDDVTQVVAIQLQRNAGR